jgi:hypothetical protein
MELKAHWYHWTNGYLLAQIQTPPLISLETTAHQICTPITQYISALKSVSSLLTELTMSSLGRTMVAILQLLKDDGYDSGMIFNLGWRIDRQK